MREKNKKLSFNMSIKVFCSFFPVFIGILLCLSLQVVHEFHSVMASTVVGNETDRLTLLEFKSKIIDGPFGVLGSWNASTHFCQWHGVTCSRRHQRATILDLQSLKLAGSISPHLGNLSFLEVLDLSNNSFTLEIPSEIGRLRRLEALYLMNNSIGGEIPKNISHCSNLIAIRVSYNQLVGKIPHEFSSLSNLELLSINANNLTGSIPFSLGNLSSISKISLVANHLGGIIPHTSGLLKNLEGLALGSNMLSGTIHSSIFNISSITVFDVGDNQIQGHIPLDIGITLPNLQIFSVFYNQITGAIPPSLSNASKLESFQVLGNKLTGNVPYLDKLQRLNFFVIAGNNLGSGGLDDLNFICTLTNATSLQILYMLSNNFGGSLPACIANLSISLTWLALGDSNISGSIPTGIEKFVNMQTLSIFNAKLSGTITPAIGELQNLRKFSFDGNRLSGNIPHSIGNLTMLIELYLSENLLQGAIPSSLGQCKSLLVIDLSKNNLSGTIPPQLIGLSSLSIYLNLCRNHLTGSLPLEVGNLKNLGVLDVSSNLLSGEIPNSFGSCTSLEQLYMQGNIFQGPIPSSFSSLKALEILDLSQNNLSGEILQFLASFKFLQILNLSYNDLEGMVPMGGVFKNKSATSILGNRRLCGGILQFQLPTCGSKISKQRRLDHTQKLVIAIVFGFVGLVLLLSSLFLCLQRKRKHKDVPNSLMNSFINVSYQNLYNATDGFSLTNLIGSGSFGSVYKGIIDEGRIMVAVKVFNLLNGGAFKSFIAECEALRNIRHRNLIKVLTACSSVDYQGNDFKALVYEFMPNGSLEEWLHSVTEQDETDDMPRNLNLVQRLNIAIDVACALSYLHHDCQPPMAHCDLKPSNVLLNEEMIAHLSDFGLARFLPLTHKQASSIGVKGSIGYIAPEYGIGSEVSTKGDVYSYGIFLLELVTRRKPTDIMFVGDFNLHNYARMTLPNHAKDIVDPILLNNDKDLFSNNNRRWRQERVSNNIIECFISIIRIGVAYSMESPQDRMDMKNVVNELQSVKNTILKLQTERGNRDD